MNQDLVDEIEYMINSLSKSGFFSHEEIIEILEDQFIEEDIDFSQYDIPSNDFDNSNFNKLDDVFIRLAEKNIVGVHTCGYDLEEGVGDVGTEQTDFGLCNGSLGSDGTQSLEDLAQLGGVAVADVGLTPAGQDGTVRNLAACMSLNRNCSIKSLTLPRITSVL